MNARAILVVLLFCLGPASPVRGEPFTILPDGSLVFNVAYATEGVFQCRTALCSGSGTNSVTLGSGGNMATLTFTGVTGTAVVGNTTVPVPLGTFVSTPVAPGFTFPTNRNPFLPMLTFTLRTTHSSPVPATVASLWTLGPGGGSSVRVGSRDFFSLPAGPNPPGYNYTDIVYTLTPFPLFIAGSGVTEIEAQVGAVPEPGTILFVGSGLALAALRARKSRRLATAQR